MRRSSSFTVEKEKITEEQFTEFLSVSKAVEKEQESDYSTMDIDRVTVGGDDLRSRLIASGKFNEAEAVVVIEIMLEHGIIEKVSYDTYRLKK